MNSRHDFYFGDRMAKRKGGRGERDRGGFRVQASVVWALDSLSWEGGEDVEMTGS